MKISKLATLMVVFLLTLNSFTALSQKFLTQSGVIQFYSEAPLENIEAINNQVMSVIDMESGDMAFSLLMTAFVFEKALMQEHFNEKYVESDKFPKASFKGKITEFDAAALSANPQEVAVSGILTIHGESKEINTTGTLTRQSETKLFGEATFDILLADFKIKIPSAVKDNINEKIEVRVKMNYEILQRE